jgi:hypothetical protein
MNVTIFGSCRQKAIERHNNITLIQERLTYPHYTKEVIQAIQFCKNKDTIPLEKTQWCFRAGILSKEPISYDFKSEFDNTDIFVIEVASRIAYEYDGLYVHHILEEEQYGFQERNKIVRRIQTDEEIEEDILTIRKLLYPKPFIIVPHLYTYTTGNRYKLIDLLKTLTSKMNIPLLDISSHLNNCENVYKLNEDRLMHLTEYGTEVCSHIYKTKIERVINEHKLKSITNVYYTSEERVRNHTFHGFGDYLRGCIALHQICTEKQIVPKFDFSHHMISNFLYCNTYVSEDTVLKDDITYVWAHDNLGYGMTDMEYLRLYDPHKNKMRLGSRHDGGYVVVDGFKYDYFISCGISNDVNFENDFIRKYPIDNILFDGTIDNLPSYADSSLNHIKKNIASYNDDIHTNLSEYLNRYKNIMLKMDIESSEYRWLEAVSTQQLNNIAQIVIEFHFTFCDAPQVDWIDWSIPINKKVKILEKLADTHYLVHFHQNTALGFRSYNGVQIPELFECTYVRKDLLQCVSFNTDILPTELCRLTFPHDATTVINHDPFVGTPNNGTKHIFTNLFPKDNISDDCRNFIIKNVLTPRLNFKQSILNMKSRLCIEDSLYDVVHIRVGDSPDTSKFDSIVSSVTLNRGRNDTVFITDSDLLSAMLRENNYKTTSEKCHLGMCDNSEREINDTLVDMLLMTTSRHIFQYSTYEWGSEFSNTIHDIYKIPITRYRI